MGKAEIPGSIRPVRAADRSPIRMIYKHSVGTSTRGEEKEGRGRCIQALVIRGLWGTARG